MKLTVTDQKFAGQKFLVLSLICTVLIVPTKAGPVGRFAQGNAASGDRDQFVLGIIDSLLWVLALLEWRSLPVRPIIGLSDVLQRQLAHQYRRSFQVNSLVLETHGQGPGR